MCVWGVCVSPPCLLSTGVVLLSASPSSSLLGYVLAGVGGHSREHPRSTQTSDMTKQIARALLKPDRDKMSRGGTFALPGPAIPPLQHPHLPIHPPATTSDALALPSV